MARVLNEFQPNTKALSREVNENFEWVQEDINDMGNALQQAFNKSLTELSASVNSNLDDLGSAKLDLDLNNISDEAVEKIVSCIMPDYSKAYSVNSGFTAPSNGWVVCQMASGESKNTIWYINDVEVARDDQVNGGGRAGRADSSTTIFIGKGQTLTRTGNYSGENAVFIPCTMQAKE